MRSSDWLGVAPPAFNAGSRRQVGVSGGQHQSVLHREFGATLGYIETRRFNFKNTRDSRAHVVYDFRDRWISVSVRPIWSAQWIDSQTARATQRDKQTNTVLGFEDPREHKSDLFLPL